MQKKYNPFSSLRTQNSNLGGILAPGQLSADKLGKSDLNIYNLLKNPLVLSLLNSMPAQNSQQPANSLNSLSQVLNSKINDTKTKK